MAREAILIKKGVNQLILIQPPISISKYFVFGFVRAFTS
jgi:hypothetical protein